eukprot:4848041-Amphidinium_carterae.1
MIPLNALPVGRMYPQKPSCVMIVGWGVPCFWVQDEGSPKHGLPRTVLGKSLSGSVPRFLIEGSACTKLAILQTLHLITGVLQCSKANNAKILQSLLAAATEVVQVSALRFEWATCRYHNRLSELCPHSARMDPLSGVKLRQLEESGEENAQWIHPSLGCVNLVYLHLTKHAVAGAALGEVDAVLACEAKLHSAPALSVPSTQDATPGDAAAKNCGFSSTTKAGPSRRERRKHNVQSGLAPRDGAYPTY